MADIKLQIKKAKGATAHVATSARLAASRGTRLRAA
jgi:hypothetical protein